MSICYLEITISIHGIDITNEEEALPFLIGWIKTETKAGLLGKNKELFNFDNLLGDDIEVEITESARTIVD